MVQEPDFEKEESLPIGLDDVGSQILEIISRGLYSDPMMIVRELIQNAVDAHPETTVDIRTGSEDLYVIDDGEGMDYQGVVDAKKIAVSFKDPRVNVGFRGIGLWSTLAAGEELRLRTSKRGEPHWYHLVIKLGEIMKDVHPSRNLREVLEGRILVDFFKKDDAADHGTTVHLSGIRPEFRERMLETSSIKLFVEKNLPVPFPTKDFGHAEAITKLLHDNVPAFRQFEVTVNGDRLFKRVPRDSKKQSPLPLEPPQYDSIYSDTGEQLAFYWMCRNTKNARIDDSNARGLVYRRHNFAIGDSNKTLHLFDASEHLRGWFFGEIHLVHDDLVPNSAREDIEPGPVREIFAEKMKAELEKKTLGVRQRSTKNNADKRVGRGRTKLGELKDRAEAVSSLEEGVRVKDELTKLADKIRKDIEPKTNKKTGETRPAPASPEWIEAGETIVEEAGRLIDKVNERMESLKRAEAGEVTRGKREDQTTDTDEKRRAKGATDKDKKVKGLISKLQEERRVAVLRNLLVAALQGLQRLAKFSSEAAELLDELLKKA